MESLNPSLHKIIKTRGGFPNEEAALKLLFLALRQAVKKWTMPSRGAAGHTSESNGLAREGPFLTQRLSMSSQPLRVFT